MTFTPPPKLLITSDNNIIELIKVIPKNKTMEERYVYRFIESVTKLGMEFEMDGKFIAKQLTNYFKAI